MVPHERLGNLGSRSVICRHTLKRAQHSFPYSKNHSPLNPTNVSTRPTQGTGTSSPLECSVLHTPSLPKREQAEGWTDLPSGWMLALGEKSWNFLENLTKGRKTNSSSWPERGEVFHSLFSQAYPESSIKMQSRVVFSFLFKISF